jgi:hypothetical protein
MPDITWLGEPVAISIWVHSMRIPDLPLAEDDEGKAAATVMDSDA